MKKLITTTILSLFMISYTYADDLVITHTISEIDKASFIANYVSVHENRVKICDPTWIGAEEDCPQVPKYTDEEWVVYDSGQRLSSQDNRGDSKNVVDTAKQNRTKLNRVTTTTR